MHMNVCINNVRCSQCWTCIRISTCVPAGEDDMAETCFSICIKSILRKRRGSNQQLSLTSRRVLFSWIFFNPETVWWLCGGAQTRPHGLLFPGGRTNGRRGAPEWFISTLADKICSNKTMSLVFRGLLKARDNNSAYFQFACSIVAAVEGEAAWTGLLWRTAACQQTLTEDLVWGESECNATLFAWRKILSNG